MRVKNNGIFPFRFSANVAIRTNAYRVSKDNRNGPGARRTLSARFNNAVRTKDAISIVGFWSIDFTRSHSHTGHGDKYDVYIDYDNKTMLN